MGREWKRRKAESYGKPAVFGYDVLPVTVSSVSGVVGHTTLGGDGGNRFVLPKDALLDFLVANVSPALTAGTLSVALHKDGVLVHSGVLNSTVPAQVHKFWHADSNNEVAAASGSVLQMHYAISSALSPGVTSYNVSARCGVRYRET
jgi:hypothetical protein